MESVGLDRSAVLMCQPWAATTAWHPKDTYTLEEADNLIRQVKIFMEQLAAII
jgi:predicted ATPase